MPNEMVPKVDSRARNCLLILTAVNAVGSALLFVGADRSLPVYIVGFVLLLPGALIATFLPWHWLWFSHAGVGLSDWLFLPVTVALNFALLCIWRWVSYHVRKRGSLDSC